MIPALRRQRLENPWGLLASQSNRNQESTRFSERPCLKYQGGEKLRKTLDVNFQPPHNVHPLTHGGVWGPSPASNTAAILKVCLEAHAIIHMPSSQERSGVRELPEPGHYS